ncbi:MAG TPA: vitamin K epoxide reductase family protein [Longimicrobiales bacterium]|nr:vitamin K epoxide reductase family protein [Longimicrobiales bacterium]
MDEEIQPTPMNRMVIAVLALIGLLISTYLTLHKFGIIGTLACGTGSCETVQTSKWAVFMGVPVPVLGLIGYAVLLVAALVGLSAPSNKSVSIAIFALANGALMFSIYLSLIEHFKIHAWCRWCIASAAITVLIWVASLAEIPRMRRTT